FIFFIPPPPTPARHPLSLHDALPISALRPGGGFPPRPRGTFVGTTSRDVGQRLAGIRGSKSGDSRRVSALGHTKERRRAPCPSRRRPRGRSVETGRGRDRGHCIPFPGS